MVKVCLIRHAQSELNLLKIDMFKQLEIDVNNTKLCLAYKFMNKDHLLDATITELGEAQCKIAKLENKGRFDKVNIYKFF